MLLKEEEHSSQGLLREGDFMGPRARNEPGSAPGEVPACMGGSVAHYEDAEEEQMLHVSARG